MANTIKYISLENLKAYTALVNEKISEGDSLAIKAVEIDGETLKFYDEIPTAGATPSYEIELPKTDFTEINKKLNTLIGNDPDKTVRLIAAEELAAQLIPDDAKESLDTLKEIAEWIQNHPDDASKMAADIAAIKTLIGTLPSYATAKDIIGYIQEAVAEENTRAVAAENKLTESVSAIQKDYLKAADKTALAKDIATNATAISNLDSVKANKTDVEAVAKDVEDLGDAVDGKADKSDVDAVNLDVYNNTAAIEQINKTLLTKADQTALEATNTEMANNFVRTNANVTANAEAIATKADQSALDTTNRNITALDTRVTTNTNNITSNAAEITDLKSRVTTAETNIDANAKNITTLQTDVSDVKSDVADMKETIDTNLGNIEGISSRIATNETNIATNAENIKELQDTIVTKASEDDLTALETKVNGAITDNIAALETKVTANTDAIATKASQDNLDSLEKRVATNETNIETIQSDVTTLIGADNGKSARTIASEELAKELIPDNAKDALNTISEIAQWIQDHPDDAAAMNEAIKALQTKLSTDEETLNTTIKNVTISGRTITVTFVNGATKTLTTQDTDTTYDIATATSNGLMSTADKIKLNGIEEGANKTVVDSTLSSTSTNPVENKAVNTAIETKANKATTLAGYGIGDAYTKSQVDANTVKSLTLSGKVITVTMGDNTTKTLTIPDTTYSNATTSAAGLMSASDKSKLDGIAAGATKTVVDVSLSSTSTNPVQNKAVNTAIEAKADKATTLSGYGIANAYTKTEVDANTVKSISISGKTVTVTKGDGTTSTQTTQDTTYSNATQTANGLMSSSDKTKLDGIATGATKNVVTSTYSATGTDAVNGKAVAEALETAKGDPNVLPTLWGKEYQGNRETTLTRDSNGLVTKAVATSDTGDSESTFTYNTDGEISKIVTTTKYGMGNATKTVEYTRTNGEITNIKESFTKDGSYGMTWADVAANVKSGAAENLYSVGDTFTDTWTNGSNTYTFPWTVLGFKEVELEDASTTKAMILGAQYLPNITMHYNEYEAFYYAEDGLTAGTYTMTMNGTDKTFTLTKDIPAGGKLAPPSGSSLGSSGRSLDVDGITTIETFSIANGTDGTDLGDIAGSYEPNGNINGMYCCNSGVGRWPQSTIRMWLNSDAEKNSWFDNTQKFATPPSQLSSYAGFLNGISRDMRENMLKIKIKTAQPSSIGNDFDITYDKVWLPSLEEMYISPQLSGEGDALEYYKQLNGTETMYKTYSTYAELKKYLCNNTSSANNYWLRSVRRDGANYAWIVNSSGLVVNLNAAILSFAPAPLVAIG